MTNPEHTSPQRPDHPVVGIPSHPVAAGVGAVAAGATGAVVGSAAGPVGTVVGAMVGAVIGGLGSDAIASAVGEAQDAACWRENHAQRPYAKPGRSYDDHGPAYAYGEMARQRHGDRDFDTLTPSWVANGARCAVSRSWNGKPPSPPPTTPGCARRPGATPRGAEASARAAGTGWVSAARACGAGPPTGHAAPR